MRVLGTPFLASSGSVEQGGQDSIVWLRQAVLYVRVSFLPAASFMCQWAPTRVLECVLCRVSFPSFLCHWAPTRVLEGPNRSEFPNRPEGPNGSGIALNIE